jgi:hypothetical protein
MGDEDRARRVQLMAESKLEELSALLFLLARFRGDDEFELEDLLRSLDAWLREE